MKRQNSDSTSGKFVKVQEESKADQVTSFDINNISSVSHALFLAQQRLARAEEQNWAGLVFREKGFEFLFFHYLAIYTAFLNLKRQIPQSSCGF